MPIDSLCTGCGKTLRVNNEFAGRKARCPSCGNIYTAGNDPNIQSSTSLQASNPANAETAYVPQSSANAPLAQTDADSWSSLPTARPVAPQSGTDTPALNNKAVDKSSTVESLPTADVALVKYFVRTPNSMIYGPSNAATVHDWLAEGRLDDSCHIREESSEQWLGIAAWRFQSRRQQNPFVTPGSQPSNQFGDIPVSSVQSVGFTKAGNGGVVLILGLVSWVLCLTFFGAIVCCILAIVFAMAELKKIKNGQSPSKERPIVLVGLLLAIANLATWCILIVGLIVVAILNP